jgi:hypothetical protein
MMASDEYTAPWDGRVVVGTTLKTKDWVSLVR